LVFALVATSHSAFAAYNESAFIDELGHQTIVTASGNEIAPVDRVQRFGVIVIHDFDVPTIARFVLGDHWERASEAQRADFRSSFRDYLVRAYTGWFAESDAGSFLVVDQRAESDTTVLVHTRLTQSASGNPIKIDWLVGRTAYGFRVVDMIVDGVSLLHTAQAAFVAAIARDGGELLPLIQQLQVAEPARSTAREDAVPQLRTKIAGLMASDP
jgi:phospholipid transport system substrate-binding protein